MQGRSQRENRGRVAAAENSRSQAQVGSAALEGAADGRSVVLPAAGDAQASVAAAKAGGAGPWPRAIDAARPHGRAREASQPGSTLALDICFISKPKVFHVFISRAFHSKF